MTIVFGFPGSNSQEIDLTGNTTPPDGWVVMESERPSEMHTARDDGAWKRDYVAEATSQKNELIALYRQVTGNWNTDLMLGDISDEDLAKLKAWVAWRKAVEAIEVSAASEENPIVFPEHP